MYWTVELFGAPVASVWRSFRSDSDARTLALFIVVSSMVGFCEVVSWVLASAELAGSVENDRTVECQMQVDISLTS